MASRAASSQHENSPPPAIPIGVRTRRVVSGRWVLLALGITLGLGVVVFLLLPGWLSPAPAPPPQAARSTASQKAEPAQAGAEGDPSRTVRERLLAEEAAARFRAEREALRERGAATWAAAAFDRVAAVAKEAGAALAAGNYTGASAGYQEGSRLLAEIGGEQGAVFARALAEGEANLEAGVSAGAADAFRRALQIHPQDARAQLGLGRAEKLDDVRARFADGEARERAGKLAEAREAYAAALDLDPRYAPAGKALKRLDERLASQRFDGWMTQGLSQLERSDWDGAEQSFRNALKLRSGDRSAADGMARAKQGLQREQLARLEREGQGLAAAERWQDALATYQRAAAIDPTVDFARDGIARSERMIALQARIDGYLSDPRRLYSPRVREEAQELLDSLNGEAAVGPRLAGERQRLDAAVKRATARITLQVTSDNVTDVMLYRVGPLGRFHTREVTLNPGTYTLVGSRPGYKDARVEVTVEPDGPAPRIFIACEEPV